MNKIFLLLLVVCTQSTAQKTEQLKWMLGTWTVNRGTNIIVEEWKIINDSTFAGKNYLVKNNTDTIPQETIELVFRNGDWYYIPTVTNQNNAQPVPFKMIFLRGMEFICENPEHDFPQRISYRRINNQIFASIEGRKNGRFNKMNFDYITQ
jgi:hypothetical protein